VEQHLELDETLPLLKAHDLSACSSEILREVPEIDSVLTHIESEPATIEPPKSRWRRIAASIRRCTGQPSRSPRLWMCTKFWLLAPRSTSTFCHCTLPDDLTMQRFTWRLPLSKTASSWSARRWTV